MGAAICCEGLTKFYGRTRGVEDLDLTVEPGKVFGFLGPNGAGKTTTIRVLLDFIRPTRGRVEVLAWTHAAIACGCVAAWGICLGSWRCTSG